METAPQTTEPAIARAIKTVGVGKKGSKDLSTELIDELAKEICDRTIPEAALGAFLGALMIKGPTAEERRLKDAFGSDIFSSAAAFVDFFAGEISSDLKKITLQLLNKYTLDTHHAKVLGAFLFSRSSGDFFRGLTASILRVRYETAEEYKGLLESLQSTFESPFLHPVKNNLKIVQIAEPFDGVDHSSLITPILSAHIQTLGYSAVNLIGRNGGPKMVYNLADIAAELHLERIHGNSQITEKRPSYGYYIHQAELSKPLDRWVDLRRQMIKRPFLSTIERFVNPTNALIHIASAFHPPYGEKMLTICENQQFPGAIIVRNGVEGTIGFPLLRPAKALATARQKDGSYLRKEFEFSAAEFLNETFVFEEKIHSPTAENNAKLVESYHKRKYTDNKLFDARVKLTCHGITQIIAWLDQNMHIKEGQNNES